MNGSVTDAQAHEWLQEIATNGWISLHYDNPTLGGPDASEISGGGYVRFKMIWTQPAGRAIWSQVDARFTGLVQTKVVYFGVWDAKQAKRANGDLAMLRAYGELPEPVVVRSGKGYVLPARMIVISFG